MIPTRSKPVNPEPLCSREPAVIPSPHGSHFSEQYQAMHRSTQVLHIPELLTMILQYVPAEDLLFRQRVNKTWQGLIKRKPDL